MRRFPAIHGAAGWKVGLLLFISCLLFLPGCGSTSVPDEPERITLLHLESGEKDGKTVYPDVAFLPDPGKVLVHEPFRSITIRDVRTGDITISLGERARQKGKPNLTGNATQFAFLGSDRIAVLIPEKNSIYILNITTDRVLQTIFVPNRPVDSLQSSQDGRYLAARTAPFRADGKGSSDWQQTKIYVWHTKTTKLIGKCTVPAGKLNTVKPFSLNPSIYQQYTGNRNGGNDNDQGGPGVIFDLLKVRKTRAFRYSTSFVAIQPASLLDDTRLVTRDTSSEAIDTNLEKLKHFDFAVSPAQTYLAFSKTGILHILLLEHLYMVFREAVHEKSFRKLAWGPDEKILAGVTGDRRLLVWNVVKDTDPEAKELSVIQELHRIGRIKLDRKPEQTGPVLKLMISPDGKRVAVLYRSGVLDVFKLPR